MTTWYRVFCRGEGEPAATAGSPVVHRFRADGDGIRAELNSWAAYLETFEPVPAHRELMERVIQSKQLFYFEGPSGCNECVRLSQQLAQLADGIYHVEEEGFFAADGTLLISESPAGRDSST